MYPNPTKCEACEKAGADPEHIYREGSILALSLYSPRYDGYVELRNYNPNPPTIFWRCSNGHQWGATSRKSCPTCGDWHEKESE